MEQLNDKVKSCEETIRTATLFLYQSYRDIGLDENKAKELTCEFIFKNCISQVDSSFALLNLETKKPILDKLMTTAKVLIESNHIYYSQLGKDLAGFLYDLLEQ